MIPLTHQNAKDLRYIFSRNVFLLTNGILFVVVVLLFVFGDVQASLFLGFILILNAFFGLIQDIRAWFALKNLQLLTAPSVIRIEKDNLEKKILVEEVHKGDCIKLKTGDQVPCDGTIIETEAVELNEGLITGESKSVPRTVHDTVSAGSIITSGWCVIRVDVLFVESRIARLTEGVKSYSVSMSPIQKDVAMLIKYSSYVLILLIIFVVIHGAYVHDSNLLTIKTIGALASLVVPQGLAFAMTLLFAYGAAHLFKKDVLLQEINATEKLGRIHNLCMDKTGTLTENTLTVERMETPKEISKEEAIFLIQAYLHGTKETSQTIVAIEKFIGQYTFVEKIEKAIPFSSWRAYGLVKVVRRDGTADVIVAGAPEVFISQMLHEDEKNWMSNFLITEAKKGKRIFCVARALTNDVQFELSRTKFSPVAVFVIDSTLRSGIKDAINFFQKRGVRIRIISGDSPETVRTIAIAAGVRDCENLITGEQMALWTDTDFKKNAREYTIFARTLPEQKAKIIEMLKRDGFTAMVGDGANDVLALKKSDLGIAMFDGAQATRQIASVVLMNNSFTALPGGVSLADSIIKNAETFAGIFIYPAFTGFFLFFITTMLGYTFPLSPLNVTFINYFTVGIPGILISYWTIFPAEKVLAPSEHSFLKKVLPFVVWSSLLQSVITGIVLYSNEQYFKSMLSNFLVITFLCITGYIFFLFAIKVYRGGLSQTQRHDLWYVTLFEMILFVIASQIPLSLRFFDLFFSNDSLTTPYILLIPGIAVIVYALLQLLLNKMYSDLE